MEGGNSALVDLIRNRLISYSDSNSDVKFFATETSLVGGATSFLIDPRLPKFGIYSPNKDATLLFRGFPFESDTDIMCFDDTYFFAKGHLAWLFVSARNIEEMFEHWDEISERFYQDYPTATFPDFSKFRVYNGSGPIQRFAFISNPE